MIRRILLLAPLLPMLLLAACGADPTTTALTVAAVSGVNPNSDNQPSPIVVRIYELKSLDTFDQLTFFDLYDHDAARLGGDLLNRREVEVQPGKTLTWTRDADPAARYVGVIAAYRSVTDVTWRASVTLKPEHRNRIDVRLEPRALSVTLVPPSRFLWIF